MNFKNFNFINYPLLKIKSIKLNRNKITQIKSADSIIFTSSNAVDLTKNYLKSFSNKVFCVGKDTKKTCFKNNIKNVFSSNGNVVDLIKLITKKTKNKSNRLVYISAKQTAVNLPLILKSKKFKVKKIVVYESKKIKFLKKNILNLIKLNKLNFVTFFSKKTANTFNQLVSKYKLEEYLVNIQCISLSKEIEKIIKKNTFRKSYVCNSPDREGFLKLINLLNKKIKNN